MVTRFSSVMTDDQGYMSDKDSFLWENHIFFGFSFLSCEHNATTSLIVTHVNVKTALSACTFSLNCVIEAIWPELHNLYKFSFYDLMWSSQLRQFSYLCKSHSFVATSSFHGSQMVQKVLGEYKVKVCRYAVQISKIFSYLTFFFHWCPR